MLIKKAEFFEKYIIHLILLFAFALRINGVDFGFPYLYGVDEKFVIEPLMRLLSVGDFNPHWFGWPGSFLIYLLAALFIVALIPVYIVLCAAGMVHQWPEFWVYLEGNAFFYFHGNPVLFHLVGRLLMVLMGTATVYLVYLIGKNLFNRSVGLLAAFCLAISPLHINEGRAIRPDVPSAALIMFAFYFLLRFLDERKKGRFLYIASFFAGCSVATKYSSAIIFIPVLICSFMADWQAIVGSFRKYFFDSMKLRTYLLRCFFCGLGAFFIFAPFFLFDFSRAVADLVKATVPAHLSANRLPGWQNHLWYITSVFIDGIGGEVFAVFALSGLVFVRKSLRNCLFLSIPVILYLVVVGWASLRWSRWLIPILPFEAILFGFGFVVSEQFFKQRIKSTIGQKCLSGVFAVLLICAAVPTVNDVIQRGNKLKRTDTRTLAKNWVEENLPVGTKIVYENYLAQFNVNPRPDLAPGLFRVGLIANHPLEYYMQRKMEYLIINKTVKDRYYAESQENKAKMENYENLGAAAQVIQIFSNKDNPGPQIIIYKIVK